MTLRFLGFEHTRYFESVYTGRLEKGEVCKVSEEVGGLLLADFSDVFEVVAPKGGTRGNRNSRRG